MFGVGILILRQEMVHMICLFPEYGHMPLRQRRTFRNDRMDEAYMRYVPDGPPLIMRGKHRSLNLSCLDGGKAR